MPVPAELEPKEEVVGSRNHESFCSAYIVDSTRAIFAENKWFQSAAVLVLTIDFKHCNLCVPRNLKQGLVPMAIGSSKSASYVGNEKGLNR